MPDEGRPQAREEPTAAAAAEPVQPPAALRPARAARRVHQHPVRRHVEAEWRSKGGAGREEERCDGWASK
jgi:hypothetical protein